MQQGEERWLSHKIFAFYFDILEKDMMEMMKDKKLSENEILELLKGKLSLASIEQMEEMMRQSCTEDFRRFWRSVL